MNITIIIYCTNELIIRRKSYEFTDSYRDWIRNNEAEVYGDGLVIWLREQRIIVEIIDGGKGDG